jgi:hypothetical protein
MLRWFLAARSDAIILSLAAYFGRLFDPPPRYQKILLFDG